MDYDPAELQNIREDKVYINCIERSKQAAISARKRGETNPPKIIDDLMIEFYGSERGGNNDIYGKYFSNCFCAKIIVNGETNISTEHYFQRQKFLIDKNDPVIIRWCREHKISIDEQIARNNLIREQMATLSPVNVAKFGQTMRSAPIRGDWDNIRNEIMWQALVAKYTQIDDYKTALLNSSDKVLIERAPTDAYWAVNASGCGENTLGVMLMAIRNLLRD